MIAAKQPVNEANNFIKGNLLPLQKQKNASFQFPPQKKIGVLVISTPTLLQADQTHPLHPESTFKHKALIDFTKPTL